MRTKQCVRKLVNETAHELAVYFTMCVPMGMPKFGPPTLKQAIYTIRLIRINLSINIIKVYYEVKRLNYANKLIPKTG